MEYSYLFNSLWGVLLNPLMLWIKTLLPKDAEGKINSDLLTVLSVVAGLGIAVAIKFIGHYDVTIMEIIIVGLGIQSTSGIVNVGTKKVIVAYKTEKISET